MFASLRSYRPTRLHVAIAAGLIVLLAIVGGVFYYINSPLSGLHASLAIKSSDVHVDQPIPVKFDHQVDLSRSRVTVEPHTAFTVVKQRFGLVVRPKTGWQPTQRYTIRVQNVPDSQHETMLRAWTASFSTQPRVGLASVSVDGKQADPKAVTITPKSKLQVSFTVPMQTATVTFKAGDQSIPPAGVQWQAGGQSAALAVPLKSLYAPFNLTLAPGAISVAGDPYTDAAGASVTGIALEPVNTTSRIDANYKTTNPFEIVIEDSGPARPQRGLQQADMVFEYISEYSVSRFTALYFNKPPDLIGPVRSCRMINPYLTYAFDGWTMCSGASVGTLHYMFGPPIVPATINDFDQGNHFFRSSTEGHFAPHNLYTTGDRALTLRQSWPLPPPDYAVDPPHPDVEAGDPAGNIDVPLHHVSWSYDAGSKQYLRTDTGTPFIDANTGQQVHAKNVVLLHVGFHDAGWIEDDNGGAHSIWYEMTGSGPAEIYSDGKVIHATWHMGQPGQDFHDNHHPMWFTDSAGNVIELNSGLTWLHVLGNGQTS